jgi:putative Mg2+ transporter-C (MgtC) family protein
MPASALVGGERRVAYPVEVLVKTVVAVILGGVVGWQREARDRPAGLRTHVLVCIGSAVYTLASLSFMGEKVDPSRVAAQVATGMGFLGAGTIIRHGSMVRGLTTAASLWTVAAIGICVGIGGRAIWVAGIATAAVLVTLTLLRRVEQRLLSRARYAQLTLHLREARHRLGEVERALEERGARMDSVHISEPRFDGLEEVEIWVRLPRGAELGQLSAELGQLEGFVSLRQEE